MRLDQALVAQGLADSRSRAQALIAAGAVRVNGRIAQKAAAQADGAVIELVANPLPWVSRAALKLDHAIKAFGLNPSGAQAMDVGASTGGFTQVLLARGAAHVWAVDVGRDQLHDTLRSDPRVTDLSGVNARDLSDIDTPPLDWIVSDVSFISLSKALPQALARGRDGAVLVALIKPQFEVGPHRVGKGGIVRDADARQDARTTVEAFVEGAGWTVTHGCDSPITGSDGNHEFLLAACKSA